MSQIINITSEALQATIRRLLPSQQGFGEDLQASNVITPIIDLTPSAEGSTVPENMQTALAFGSQTAFDVNNTTTNLFTGGGFYRIVGVSFITLATTGQRGSIDISDGATSKAVWSHTSRATTATGGHFVNVTFDQTVFLRPQDTVSIFASANVRVSGSARQVADATGTLVNPVGFTPQ